MLIREKDGRYAGEIREFPSHIALELIAAGRAVNPFNQIEDAPEQAPAVRPATGARAKTVAPRGAVSRTAGAK